jgi:hypothetical protein
MEHLDNDMDDLFQKAGDHYPLKTNESDWDGVLGKLGEGGPRDQTAIPGVIAKGKTNKRRWGFLLLLIPIGLGSVIYFSHAKKKQINTPVPITAETNSLPLTGEENKKAVHESQSETQSANGKNKSSGDIILPADHFSKDRRNQKNGLAVINRNSTSAPPRIVHGKDISSGEKNSNAASVQTKESTTIPAAGKLQDPQASTAVSAGIAANTASATSASGQKDTSTVPDKLTAKSIPNDSLPNLEPSMKDVKIKSSKGFYVGLLVGPDWSTVHFQSVKNTGFSLGILVGYRFNKRLSVESGFMFDKKYYYSTGEYFNTAKTGLPPYEKVNNLTGNCYMFEIPLNVRYDFETHKNHSFFANAGLSSYLMKKENYSVNLEGSSGPWMYPDTSYLNSTNNLFSILQLSAGYERTIGPKTKIRIEPYIKIPLQGIGIGSMPISSAGIYFGITYSFR